MAIVAPILIYIYPPQGESQKKDLTVALDKPADQIGDGEAVKFAAPAETGFVMQDGGGDNAAGKIAFGGFLVKEASGDFKAFAVNCSHLGCSVAFNADAKRFDCPCHGSQFSITGTVVHGPAAFPLSNLAWKQGNSPSEILVQGLTLKGIG